MKELIGSSDEDSDIDNCEGVSTNRSYKDIDREYTEGVYVIYTTD